MSEQRICTICDTAVEGRQPCPYCSDETNWRDVSAMSGEEKIQELERWMTLQVEMHLLYKRLHQIFGRYVATHELTSTNKIHLHAELVTGIQPTFDDVVNLIPENKRVGPFNIKGSDSEQE